MLEQMAIKIDELNLQILSDLLSDGRKTFAEIAQENDTSKEVIAKRFKQLKARGVILGFTTQNSARCYGGSFVANILLNVQRGKVFEVQEKVKEVPHVIHAYPLTVQQAVSTEVALNNITELDETKKLIHKQPFVLDTEVTIWTGARNMPENLSVFNRCPVRKKTVSRETALSKRKPRVEIDEIDRAIIDKLAVNGRIAFAEIAKPIGVSTETIVRRYERLKESGDLRVVVQIDPNKIGYFAFAAFTLSFSQEALAENIEKISQTPDVNRIITAAGFHDLTYTLMIRDIEHFLEMQDQMVSLPNIRKINVGMARMFCPWPMQREFISTF
ncbi:MAG: Lrp/AsnC family transcriptional regulator [Candidatus Bathyarchaeota archaeon]|nr:Lrp/AsnC family transcriptional regulator [Candidatus Bathyarchaeota archaeon]